MEITKYLPLFITFIFTLIGSYITIKINIIELKKDISFLRSKIEADDNYQLSNQNQAKIDMKEVKDDLKIICKLINEMQVNFAKMEARSEGKDEVINELKEAVTVILKSRK